MIYLKNFSNKIFLKKAIKLIKKIMFEHNKSRRKEAMFYDIS